MKTNAETIQEAVDYIDLHLDEALDLDRVAGALSYSKYHLSRMFAALTGFTLHQYIRRRRLTEAARLLVFTDRPILDIALGAGYETQRSFTVGFKALYRCSPRAYRKKKNFHPLQLKFTADGRDRLRGDRILDIRTVDCGPIGLAGFRRSTRPGFFVIGACWRKLHARKHLIPGRVDPGFLVGLNDYSRWDLCREGRPAFDYLAAAEVTSPEKLPRGMTFIELPPGRYLVFCFRARCEDSLEPVAGYIYGEWFPQSTCRLNDGARYDFARYGESVDSEGKSQIEYWVPVL